MVAQVHADFENIGRAANLSTVCLYGGAPMSPQEQILRRGCDVVVGTPGRVKDHLERGNLKLQDLMCVDMPTVAIHIECVNIAVAIFVVIFLYCRHCLYRPGFWAAG